MRPYYSYSFYPYFFLHSLFVVSLFILSCVCFKKLQRIFFLLFLLPYFIFTLATSKHIHWFENLIKPGAYKNLDELFSMGMNLVSLFYEPYYIMSSILMGLILILFMTFDFSQLRIHKKIIIPSAVFVLGNIIYLSTSLMSKNFVISDKKYLYSHPVVEAVTSGFIQTYVSLYIMDQLLAIKIEKSPGKISLLLSDKNLNDHHLTATNKGKNGIKIKKESKQSIIVPTRSHSPRPNFIFIQFESLDDWLLDYEFNGKPIVPFLSELKNHSLYFKNFYAVRGPSSGSSDIERLTLLSLLYNPLRSQNIKVKYTSLVDILRENGYQTASFHSNTGSFFSRHQLHENIGFEKKYFGEEAFHGEGMGTMYTFDRPFYEQVLGYIRKDFDRKSPFFFYLITMQTHYNFKIYMPETNQYLLDGINEEDLHLNYQDKGLLDYISSIHEADQALESFFRGLARDDLLENTFIFIYSDHNSGMIPLNCHGKCISLLIYHKDLFARKDSELSHSHSHFLYQLVQNKENTHWLRQLNFKKGVYLKVSSHLDLAPTVTYLMGVEEPDEWLGSSLISTQTRQLGLEDTKIMRSPGSLQEKSDPIDSSNFNLGYLLVPREANNQETLYYERGITVIDERSVLFNAKGDLFGLTFEKKNLLDYYRFSIDKYEAFK